MITDDRPFGPCFDGRMHPGAFGQPPPQLVNAIGRIGRRLETLLTWFAPAARPGGNAQGRDTSPHQLVATDRRKGPFAPSVNRITKRGGVARARIRRNPATGQAVARGASLEEPDGHLGVRAKGQVGRPADLVAQSSAVVGKPVLRNEELSAQQGVAFGRSGADKDANLARTDVAKGAAVVAGHAGGVAALLRQSGFVDQENTIFRITKGASDQVLVDGADGGSRPGALADERLQSMDSNVQRQSDRRTRCARKRKQQAMDVMTRPGMLIRASECGCKLLDVVVQSWEQGFNISHRRYLPMVGRSVRPWWCAWDPSSFQVRSV